MDALVFGILSHAQSHEICIYTNQNQHNQQKTMCLWRTLALLASSIQHFSTFWQHQTLQPLPKCKTSDTQEPTGESSRLLNIATFWVYYKYPINITTVYGYMYIYICMYVCIYICMYVHNTPYIHILLFLLGSRPISSEKPTSQVDHFAPHTVYLYNYSPVR